MNVWTRVGGFATGLVAVAGAAALFGSAVGPIGTTPVTHSPEHSPVNSPAHSPEHEGEEGDATTADIPGGVLASRDGYTLDLVRDRFEPQRRAGLAFRILDADGRAVTAYEASHTRDLHLIAVTRDLADFQHVHPTMAEDGTWRVPLDLRRSGDYRVFADFVPAGAEQGLTLGHDLTVTGAAVSRPLPAASGSTTTGPYGVELAGRLVPGTTSPITVSVERDGAPQTDLQPYLGAYGHLVAIRRADLAYLHVHPEGTPGDGETTSGPDIAFQVEVPSPGDYRLFLDFRHDDRVRTAAFTVDTATTPHKPTTDADANSGDGGEEHAH